MALLPFLAVGGLLASSKKVRKEIKRFGKRVKKQLKRTVKSKAFKIIAAAALIITGAHFVAGLMGAGGGTAATLTTTKAAADAGMMAKTATAIANGAKTAYNTLATAGYSAGQSTTAFLSEGFNKITGDAAGEAGKEALKDTAIDTGTGVGSDLITAVQGEAPAVLPTEIDLATLPQKRAAGETAKVIAPKVDDIVATGKLPEGVDAAQTQKQIDDIMAKKRNGLLAKKFGEEFKKQTEKSDTTAPTPASFDSYTEAFEGSALFTPQQIADLRVNLPLIDPRTFASGAIDANAFFRTKQQLA